MSKMTMKKRRIEESVDWTIFERREAKVINRRVDKHDKKETMDKRRYQK